MANLSQRDSTGFIFDVKEDSQSGFSNLCPTFIVGYT